MTNTAFSLMIVIIGVIANSCYLRLELHLLLMFLQKQSFNVPNLKPILTVQKLFCSVEKSLSMF